MKREELFNPDAQEEAIIGTMGEDKWGVVAERRIQEAMERGEFDNLSGMGQRQGPDEYSNPYIKAELRMAYSMLRHNGILPDWAVLANEIEADRERLTLFVEQHFTWLAQQMSVLPDLPLTRLRHEVKRLKEQHEKATRNYRESLGKINQKINHFNMITPSSNLAMVTYPLEDRLSAWQQRTPAYLEYWR